ncbi:MAG: type 1 periplasmic binding fold superfamily protein [Flavobacterium sp.]|nr:type 1 periplasmic binding fold superfamily protein [Flavobacterium sp.]
MKQFTVSLFLCFLLLISSCSRDESELIVPINEVELITTVKAVFTPTSGDANVVLEHRDLDGEGGNEPIVTISKPFEKSKTYNGIIYLKNELANPSIDITPEIIAEALDHQFFYQTTGNLPPFRYANISSNFDSNGKPLGIHSVVTTTSEASGLLQISLRHGPNKNGVNVSNGIIDNAGGATDVEVRFNITVE